MILLQFIIMFSSGYFYLLYPYLGNAMLCCAMCIFSQFMLALKSAVLGVFTPGKLAKATNQYPSSSLFRDLVVIHLPALHWIWSLKKPGVVSVVRKIKA